MVIYIDGIHYTVVNGELAEPVTPTTSNEPPNPPRCICKECSE
jgi:hypothetical protein